MWNLRTHLFIELLLFNFKSNYVSILIFTRNEHRSNHADSGLIMAAAGISEIRTEQHNVVDSMITSCNIQNTILKRLSRTWY